MLLLTHFSGTNPMQALAFYIDAPLQSWGSASKFQYRETNRFPTKSAIVGLIAAALGVNKHGEEEATALAPIIDLKLTVVRLEKKAKSSSRFTDFHTVGGGYDKKKLWEKMSIPAKANGASPNTVLTYRSYLTDACFVALLEGDSVILTQVKTALENPRWGIWFGRKTCIPASPLSPLIKDSRDTVFKSLLHKIFPDQSPADFDTFERQEEITENPEDVDELFYQSDQPIAFGKHHGPVPAAYRARGVRQHRPESSKE